MVTPRVALSSESRARMRLFFGQSHASSDEDIDQRTFLSTRRVEPLGVVLLRRDAWCRWPAGEFAAERQAQTAAAANSSSQSASRSSDRSVGAMVLRPPTACQGYIGRNGLPGDKTGTTPMHKSAVRPADR